MVRAAALIAAVVLSFSSAAHARDWPKAGGWFISETEDGCGMLTTFEGSGSTQVAFFLEADGSSGILVSNEAWSAVQGKKYELSYLLNGSTYSGNSVGSDDGSGSRKGFVAKFGPDFASDFEKATGLTIMKGDVVVDDLSLRGSAAALAVLRRCVTEVSARLAAESRERARLAHIAGDPFEESSAEVSAQVEDRWISADDYPPSSLMSREEGASTVEYEVTPSGLVANCHIKESSGSAALDRATCQVLTRRGRYTPSSGSHDTVAKTYTYRWKLPPE